MIGVMRWFGVGLIFLLFIFHIYIAPAFGPPWDFPHHLKIGEMQLGIDSSYPFISYPYAFFTDVVPVVIATVLPESFRPTSYLYISIISGFVGIFLFYLLLRRYFGDFVAISSSLLFLSIPRYVGHMHVNMKDVGSAAFFMASLYFFLRFCEKFRFQYGVFCVLFFTLAANTKMSVYQLFPVFFIGLFMQIGMWQKKLSLLGLLAVIPISIWILLWPHSLYSLFTTISTLDTLFSANTFKSPLYALVQLLETTPLPVFLFSVIGILFCLYDFRKSKKIIYMLFPFLFFYTLFKYPIFGLPIIDDVRYFLDVYFAVAFLSVYGLYRVFGKYALVFVVFLIGFCVYRTVEIHPYEITYVNALSTSKDKDFWASSYREVFGYVNKNASKGSIVSARLAPELAYYLIRPDLRKNLNSKSPAESDFVVILNRPSYFKIFRVENFVIRHTPTKVFRTKTGVPLAYVYELRRRSK